MKNDKIIFLAEQFLRSLQVNFVTPGTIGLENNNRVEVIFLVPMALDPNVVIDPPDVRAWVDINTGKVERIYQM